jgi:dienelactone hydrolase
LPIERKPVSDELYAAYSRVFAYEQGPMNSRVEASETTRVWNRQRITFDAAYGHERMVLYLYLPRTGSPPYQTVIYWPGSAAVAFGSIEQYSTYFDFVLRSGRALAFPAYKGTFERGDRSPPPEFGTAAHRDMLIHGVNDLRRTVDYLETRSDIEQDAIAFFGHSWGAINGPVAVAQEPRIRTVVLYVGFLPFQRMDPEVDPVNALPRIRRPALVLNSEFDVVPLQNARRYFELLGTPAADKKHVIAPGGHFVPRDLLIRETLEWLDTHVGLPGR